MLVRGRDLVRRAVLIRGGGGGVAAGARGGPARSTGHGPDAGAWGERRAHRSAGVAAGTRSEERHAVEEQENAETSRAAVAGRDARACETGVAVGADDRELG